MQNLNCKMENKNVKFEIPKEKINYGFEKVAKVNQKIYSKRKSSDSSASFEFKRARKVDFRALSKNFRKI